MTEDGRRPGEPERWEPAAPGGSDPADGTTTGPVGGPGAWPAAGSTAQWPVAPDPAWSASAGPAGPWPPAQPAPWAPPGQAPGGAPPGQWGGAGPWAGQQPGTPQHPWAPGQPPPAAPSGKRAPAGRLPPGTGSGILVGLLVALLVVGAGALLWFLVLAPDEEAVTAQDRSGGGQTAQAGAPTAPSAAPTPSRTTAAPAPPPSPRGTTPPVSLAEREALQELQARRQASLRQVELDGRWVAQLASKSVGIVDPLQVAANGTHQFFATDILADNDAAVEVAAPSPVLVLTSTDFGKRSTTPDGLPYWITVVDDGFGSAADVRVWCELTYPELTPEQLANACQARTLDPPHD